MRFSLIRATVAAALAIGGATAAAQVPNPTINGPIAATAKPGDPSRDYPFFSSYIDLSAHGFVEEEYFFNGMANTYVAPVPATALQTAEVDTHSNQYQTRMIVRRPAKANKFNGVVLVEWLNVTNRLDMENTFYQIDEHILRSGYAWVGVSVQRIGVNRLRDWNPSRYGSLDVSGRVPGGEQEFFITDQLSNDIFSQAVQAIRHPLGVAPLGPLKARKVIATGHSQSASRLVTYINRVHQRANVVDGFALHGPLGNAVRTDAMVPVAKVSSEFDVQWLEFRVRREDDEYLRTWEVAGTSHNDRKAYGPRVLLQRRDTGSNVEANLSCKFMPPGSAVPFHHVMAAAIDGMTRWVTQGIPMPSAPRLELTVVNNRAHMVRDELGIVKGGIRLAAVDAPVSQSSGTNIDLAGGTCDRWGYSEPLSSSTLDALYKNHGDYVSRVRAVTQRNIADGFIVKDDAAATVKEAAKASIGR